MDDRPEAESDRAVISVSGGPSRNRSARESVAPQRDQTGGCLTCIRTPCPAATKNASMDHRLNFFAGSRNSMEATEDDERREHGHSKSDFRKPYFDRFYGRNCDQTGVFSEASTSFQCRACAEFSSMALTLGPTATMVNGTKGPPRVVNYTKYR